MIPRGRPTYELADVAARAGVSLNTWRRRHHAAFVAAVHPLPASQRPLLYDVGQVEAHLTGAPVLPLAELVEVGCEEDHQDQEGDADEQGPRPHADDLLTDAEAGEVAGLSASTIRADAAVGRMDSGEERHGRRWWSRAAAEERAQRPPEYKGRTPGSKDRTTRRRPDHRVAEVARELDAAAAGRRGPVTTAEVARRYDVSERTAERITAAARASEPA